MSLCAPMAAKASPVPRTVADDQPIGAWLGELQRALPPDVRVPDLRAMFRSASPRGIAWDSLVRRFGAHDATRILSALQAHDLLAAVEVDGRYARTPSALAWIERTMRTEFGADNVRAALRGLVQRAQELRSRSGAVLVPQRILACSQPPRRGADRAKQVDVHIVLMANEPALATARAEAMQSRKGAIRSRHDEAAWLAARQRATVSYLAGGTPMLRATASTEPVPGTEIFPDGLPRWLESP